MTPDRVIEPLGVVEHICSGLVPGAIGFALRRPVFSVGQSARWSSARRASRCYCTFPGWRGIWRSSAREERACARGTRGRSGARDDNAHRHHLARRTASPADLGSGSRNGPTRSSQDRCGYPGLLLRPAKPLPARTNKDTNRLLPLFPEGRRPGHPRRQRDIRCGRRPQCPTENQTSLEDAGGGA